MRSCGRLSDCWLKCRRELRRDQSCNLRFDAASWRCFKFPTWMTWMNLFVGFKKGMNLGKKWRSVSSGSLGARVMSHWAW